MGRRIAYRAPGLVGYVRRARGRGMAPGMVAVTSVICSTARPGLAAGLTDDVRAVTGRAPTGVRPVLERDREAFVPTTTGPEGTPRGSPHRGPRERSGTCTRPWFRLS